MCGDRISLINEQWLLVWKVVQLSTFSCWKRNEQIHQRQYPSNICTMLDQRADVVQNVMQMFCVYWDLIVTYWTSLR